MSEEIVGYFRYCVAKHDDWSCCDFEEKGTHRSFSVTGDNVPQVKDIPYKLYGRWGSYKGKKQFQCDAFELESPEGKKSFVAYMASLRCKIGAVKANRIYNTFGDQTWAILRSEPQKFTVVKGVSKEIVSLMCKRIDETQAQMRLTKYLSSFNLSLTARKVAEIVKAFSARGLDAVDCVGKNPYELSNLRCVPFETADEIGSAMKITRNDPRRLQAAIPYLIDKEAGRGSVCVQKDIFLQLMQRKMAVSAEDCKEAINCAFRDKKIRVLSSYIYASKRFEEETLIVEETARLMRCKQDPVQHIDTFIEEYEAANFKLADSQVDAVKSVFLHQVNVITGGPGTGKSTIIKAVLYAHGMVYGKGSDPVLLAPTGRAARRMAEVTGYPATTVHSAVDYRGEEIECGNDEMLSGNLFIVDECSMLDQFIAGVFLSKIPDGAKVVLVGDPDQLPSVGCGNVLQDMISSEVVPVTKLNVIFRQEGTNPIVANAQAINAGSTDLVLSRTFRVFDCKTPKEIFQAAFSLYVRSVKAYGIDNVVLLNPYRNKSDLNVDMFNKALQDALNPPGTGLEIHSMGHIFRENDKVMQTKNTEYAKNGDVGYIRRITREPDPDDPREWAYTAYIEFNGDGDTLRYGKEELQNVDLAYCTTVHSMTRSCVKSTSVM